MPNNRFIFHLSQYDGLKRIISIKGAYKINSSNIIFLPDTLCEVIQGQLVRDPENTLSDSWTIRSGKTISSKINAKAQTSKIDKGFNKAKIVYISIDGNLFYKISDDPKYN